MKFLQIENLRKSFGANRVVQSFNLAVERGEFISFLGPSGCGKTTTLRMIAGFELPSGGTIRIADRDVTYLRPNQRNVGMVFQSYALFPNLTVAANIAFGLKVAKRSQPEIRSRTEEMLRLIKLPLLGDRYPYQLSGGQQQRVALARALAIRPQVLLLDEPLSALDAKIRVSLREEIRTVQRDLGITTIYVTHDQEEALSMSDRIVVMNEGRIEQIGTPFEIYNRPRTRFVASFVGTLNILSCRLVEPASGKVVIDEQEIVVGSDITDARAGEVRATALRPEAISLRDEGSGRNRMRATIEEVSFLGSVVRVRARFKEQAVSLDTFNNPSLPPPERGQVVTLSFGRDDLLVLDRVESDVASGAPAKATDSLATPPGTRVRPADRPI
jgi:putative spermidine/putrescine transport system ATP-binding protein